LIPPKLLFYIMIFTCVSFVYTATQGSFIGLMYIPIQVPILVSAGYLVLFLAFVLSLRKMETKLRIVGFIYCLAGLALSYVLFSPFIPMNMVFDTGSGSAFLLLYPIGLVMVSTFYLTYFWIAIRAQMTLVGAVILGGLSVVLIGSGFLEHEASPAETSFIGIPGLIVSLIAYFKAKPIIEAKKTTEQ